MSTLKARNAPTQTKESGHPDRPDPYQQVTDLIIQHLEKGVVPWRCPWNREVGRPLLLIKRCRERFASSRKGVEMKIERWLAEG